MINDGPEQSHKQGKVAKTRQKPLLRKDKRFTKTLLMHFQGNYARNRNVQKNRLWHSLNLHYIWMQKSLKGG